MSIYLIRHTAPLIEKGICYGQSDIDVRDTFLDEAAVIRQFIPPDVQQVYSSPLLRCRKLATHLFPNHPISWEPDLMEIHCGEWEMMHWDAIPREVIDPWMNDFVNKHIPGGESYVQLFNRVVRCFEKIAAAPKPSVAVAHGGVIRSILAHINRTPLLDSFTHYKLHYGCVVRLDMANGQLRYEMLSNIPAEKEQHKPTRL